MRAAAVRRRRQDRLGVVCEGCVRGGRVLAYVAADGRTGSSLYVKGAGQGAERESRT
jgi:hypothetical protein